MLLRNVPVPIILEKSCNNIHATFAASSFTAWAFTISAKYQLLESPKWLHSTSFAHFSMYSSICSSFGARELQWHTHAKLLTSGRIKLRPWCYARFYNDAIQINTEFAPIESRPAIYFCRSSPASKSSSSHSWGQRWPLAAASAPRSRFI